MYVGTRVIITATGNYCRHSNQLDSTPESMLRDSAVCTSSDSLITFSHYFRSVIVCLNRNCGYILFFLGGKIPSDSADNFLQFSLENSRWEQSSSEVMCAFS